MEKDPESGRSGHISHFKRVLHQGVLNDEIINHPYRGSGTENDPFLVTWIDNDPVNPQNYSNTMKWCITMLVAVATLAVAFVSSAYSGGIEEILKEFRVVQIIGTLGISLFVLGFAIGPLLWAPLSGRCLMAHSWVCSLTSNRTVRPPVPLLRYIHDAHHLQCWRRWVSKHPNPCCSEISGRLLWIFALDQRWRRYCGYVSSITQRSCDESFRCGSIPGTCNRTHW